MRYTVTATFVACLALAMVARAADDLQQLTADVASDDKEVCLGAIDELGKLGAEAKSAVPALVRALGQEDETVCWHAARALGSIGPDAEAAVPGLVKALDNEDPQVCAYAAFALGKIGSDSEDVVDALIDKAFDKSVLVRRACFGALRAINPPVDKTLPVVLKTLEEADPAIVMPALHTAAEEGKKIVPRLCEVLEHEKGCYWACLVLAEIGADAEGAVPHLKKNGVLKHRDPDVRLQALVTLGQIGPASKELLPDVVEAFEKDEYDGVRYAAAFALGKIGLDDASKGALRKALADDDPFLQMVSAWALAKNDPGDTAMVERAVRLIVAAFKSEDTHLRRLAASAAVEFDVRRDVVVPVLVDALKDKDPDVVGNAIAALAEFGAEALEHVDESLKNKDLRRYAVLLIRRVGEDAESAVPALIEALEQKAESEDDVLFHREVQFTLAALGPKAREAVPALIASLDSDREEIRASACFALGRIGRKASMRRLRALENDESPMVRLAAIFALVKIQPDDPVLVRRAVVDLSKALDSDDERYRAGAALALGELSEELGDLGKRTVPRLKPLLNDESPLVRDMAAEALRKLGG